MVSIRYRFRILLFIRYESYDFYRFYWHMAVIHRYVIRQAKFRFVCVLNDLPELHFGNIEQSNRLRKIQNFRKSFGLNVRSQTRPQLPNRPRIEPKNDQKRRNRKRKYLKQFRNLQRNLNQKIHVTIVDQK